MEANFRRALVDVGNGGELWTATLLKPADDGGWYEILWDEKYGILPSEDVMVHKSQIKFQWGSRVPNREYLEDYASKDVLWEYPDAELGNAIKFIFEA